jgi:hypothetical protein
MQFIEERNRDQNTLLLQTLNQNISANHEVIVFDIFINSLILRIITSK